MDEATKQKVLFAVIAFNATVVLYQIAFNSSPFAFTKLLVGWGYGNGRMMVLYMLFVVKLSIVTLFPTFRFDNQKRSPASGTRKCQSAAFQPRFLGRPDCFPC